MKLKIFFGSYEHVEASINVWLAAHNKISISEILQSECDDSFTISIFYISS